MCRATATTPPTDPWGSKGEIGERGETTYILPVPRHHSESLRRRGHLLYTMYPMSDPRLLTAPQYRQTIKTNKSVYFMLCMWLLSDIESFALIS